MIKIHRIYINIVFTIFVKFRAQFIIAHICIDKIKIFNYHDCLYKYRIKCIRNKYLPVCTIFKIFSLLCVSLFFLPHALSAFVLIIIPTPDPYVHCFPMQNFLVSHSTTPSQFESFFFFLIIYLDFVSFYLKKY